MSNDVSLYFGSAKVLDLNVSTDVNELRMRPAISIIGNATHEHSKYLADLLRPLSKSVYSIAVLRIL